MFRTITLKTLCMALLLGSCITSCTTWLPPGESMPPLRPEYDKPTLPNSVVSASDVKDGQGVAIHSLDVVEMVPSFVPVSAQGELSAQEGVSWQPGPLDLEDEITPGEMDTSGLMLVSMEGMELNRFIHLVFGKYLRVNYMVDPTVEKRKDPVTIHMQESIEKPAFIRLVQELLSKYRVAAHQRSGTWFIEPVKGQATPTEDFLPIVGRVVPETLDEGFPVLLIAPIHNITADNAISIVRQMYKLPQGSDLRRISQKALFIKADAGTVRKILNLLSIVDQPYFQEQQVRLLRLEYIDVAVMIERLAEILPPLGITVNTTGKEIGITMVPIPEISSLLLVSPNPDWLQTIRSWADRLDTPAVLGPEPRIFIFRPQNRKAGELAQVILGLRGEGSKTSTTRKVKKNLSDTKMTEKVAEGVPKQTTGASVLKNSEMTITVDESRNALVIFASPETYAEVLKNLEALDTLARQVLIEVTIAEITLTDELQYGVEWFLRNNKNKDWDFAMSTINRLALGDGGILATFSKTSGDFLAILNAFAQDDRVKIMANPRLVVLDNESASFSVGTDVPVVTSEATATDLGGGGGENGPSVLRNIQYRKTGVSMNVTPTIYSNGILRLEIDQNLSEAQKNDVSPETDSPLVLDRSLQTTITLKSGEYILIAGLISETGSSGNQRIPLLGDIPWLGNLFKTTSYQTTRTELMIQIRPIILDSVEDALYETNRFENSLRELRELSRQTFHPDE